MHTRGFNTKSSPSIHLFPRDLHIRQKRREYRRYLVFLEHARLLFHSSLQRRRISCRNSQPVVVGTNIYRSLAPFACTPLTNDHIFVISVAGRLAATIIRRSYVANLLRMCKNSTPEIRTPLYQDTMAGSQGCPH